MTVAGEATSPVPTARQPSRVAAAVSFGSLVVGNFLVILDVSILNVALPDVRRDLHATTAQLPWTVDSYTVLFAGLLLASGSIADRFGPRRVYRLAMSLFALLSLVCAAAPNAPVLIAGRALLGAAAAGLVPASLALLAELYPEPKRRSSAVGLWAALSSLGFVLGPVIGGALVELGGWRLVFLVNPVVVLLALLPTRILSAYRPTTYRRIDGAGLALSTAGLAALTFGLIDGGVTGWTRPVPLAALALGVIAFALLFVVERRAEAPVLPPRLLAVGRVRGDLLAAAMASFCFYGALFSMTLWMIQKRGLNPLETGVAFLPMTVPACVLPWLAGRAVARFGAGTVILGGLAFQVMAGAMLLGFGDNPPTPALLVAQVALTIGGTMVVPAATADISLTVPRPLAATGQGAQSASRQAGVAVGIAILGTVTTLRVTGLVILLVAAATVLLVAALLRSRGEVAAAS